MVRFGPGPERMGFRTRLPNGVFVGLRSQLSVGLLIASVSSSLLATDGPMIDEPAAGAQRHYPDYRIDDEIR